MMPVLNKFCVAVVLLTATAFIPACTQTDKATIDQMSKDVSDAKIAAESAAQSAQQAADAAKAAQKAADEASMVQSHATGKGMRNK